MAKEGSTPPKERVNIVYKPATEGVQEEIELPFKVLVMGDFISRKDDTPLEERKTININKDNFDDVLASLGISLNIDVANRLSDNPEDRLSVTLDFKSIKDFSPDAIVEKIPELKKLKEIREALKSLKGPLGNIPEFRKKIAQLIEDEEKRKLFLKELGISPEEETPKNTSEDKQK